MNNNFVTYIKEYIDFYLPIQRRYSKNTIKTYCKSLLDFISFLSKINVDIYSLEIHNIDIKYIEQYIANLVKKNNKATTINTKLATIKSFFKYAENKDIRNIDICSKIYNLKKQKEERKPHDYFEIEELSLIFKQFNLQNEYDKKCYIMLQLLYDGALRVSELTNLKVGNIHLGDDRYPEVVIENSKNNKSRIITISKITAMNLKKYIRENNKNDAKEYLFLNKANLKYTESGIYYIVSKYCNKAKENCNNKEYFTGSLNPHKFRHTKATHMIENNIRITTIQNHLGHSNIATTEVYAKESIKKIAEELEKNSKLKPLQPKYRKSKTEKEKLEEFLKNKIIN